MELRSSGTEFLVYRRASSGLAKIATAPFTPWGRRSVARAAERWRADLIHGLHFEVPARSKIPSVVTIQDLIPLDHPDSMPNPIRRRVFRRMVASAVDSARRIIVSGELTGEALARHGLDRAPIVVIPIGLGASWRSSSEDERAAARARWGGGRRYVAAVAEPRAHKNLDGLAAAAAIVKSHADVAFVCRGTKVDRFDDVVDFVGPMTNDELRSFYGGAELLLLPSFVEGYGLPALEALACGVPVVSGDNIGVLPYIRPGVVVVDVADAKAMATAVCDLIDDRAQASALVADAATSIARLTLVDAATATARVYQDVLGHG